MSQNTSSEAAIPQVLEALEFLTSIVSSACEFKASDIHIRADHQIMMRLDGRIRTLKGSPEMSESLIFPFMLHLIFMLEKWRWLRAGCRI
jgi:Tfp pilus assembly pilus retraction ATPase PilT